MVKVGVRVWVKVEFVLGLGLGLRLNLFGLGFVTISPYPTVLDLMPYHSNIVQRNT